MCGPGVHLIGFGSKRPVFVLADNTPGFQQGLGYMVVFAGGPPRSPRKDALEGTVPLNNTIPDANPGTFYSAMSNIDFEMGRGNPAAVAIRFHIAQHCFLTHMNFHIDSGLAALKDVGNEAEDLHFFGGRYGCPSRSVYLEHHHPRLRLGAFERAPRPRRDQARRCGELGAGCAADRGGARRKRVRSASRDSSVQ